ncbi:NB-ARC domain-containing protein, partial [Streptosporangium jomthongense]
MRLSRIAPSRSFRLDMLGAEIRCLAGRGPPSSRWSMARRNSRESRNKHAAEAATGTLVVLTIAVGLPVNVVSDYLPSMVTDHHTIWITGLVVVSFVAVLLTWLVPRLADRRVNGTPFQVQPKPPGWVSRDELDVVVRELTGAAGGTTALWGAGGFGKTSLAVAACHDRRVRRHFTGGIVWVTLGQDCTGAEGAELVGSICETVSGKRPQITDVRQLSHHLADLLAEQGRTLLVVDDVWTRAQLEPFLSVAGQSRLLVTTHRPRTLPPGSVKIEVNAMTPAVAAQLLGRDLPAMHPKLRWRLLEVAGGWPLLLTLVNARLLEDVERGAAVNVAAEQVVDRLRRAGPAALDITDSGQRETAVKATIDYSLEALDNDQRERFLELGIFAEDIDIPLEMVTLLWQATAGLNVEQSHRLCEDLVGLSLLSLRWVGGNKRVIALHDVVRAFAHSEHGLGPHRQMATNQLLIGEARSLIRNGADGEENNGGWAWWRLPAEHFLWDHLAYHLGEGRCKAELGLLVSDVRWILARLDQAGPLALETDLTRCESAEAADTHRLIARVGHLLGTFESPKLSRSNRLAHLSVLPHLRDQIRHRYSLTDPVLFPLPPMLENGGSVPSRNPTGRIGGVNAVAISSDGSWLASASQDGTVRTWGVDGHWRATLTGHIGGVNAVAISSDGSWLASASHDGTVRTWNTDGTPRATLTGHTGGVNAVAISPDGSWLASASQDGTVRTWNTDGTPRATLTGHTGEVNAVAISSDNSWLASASQDGTVRTWGADGGLRSTITGHTDWVNAVAISSDNSWLASASRDGTVRIWNTDGTPRATLTGHTGGVKGVAIVADGSWLASTSRDGTVRIWGADGGLLTTLTGRIG